MKDLLNKIVIIGNSIGGLTAALALHKKGYHVDVYEDPDAKAEQFSAIHIWPAAAKILKNLGVYEEILASGNKIDDISIRTSTGRNLQKVQLSQGSNLPGICIEFNKLQKILLKALPADTLHPDKEFKNYRNENNHVFTEFKDGTVVQSQLLIGADGINSKVREQLKNDGRPEYRGYRYWHGIVNYNHNDIPGHTSIEFLGKGKRFGITPIGNGRISWWATANEKLSQPHHMANRKKKLRSKFRTWFAPISLLIGATPDENIYKMNAFDRAPSPGWHDGKVVLIGNAAHATTPNRAMTPSLAIEDAWVLTDQIEKESQMESALVNFEAIRYPRTSNITAISLKHGEIGQWGNTFSVLMRNNFFKMFPISLDKKFINELTTFKESK